MFKQKKIICQATKKARSDFKRTDFRTIIQKNLIITLCWTIFMGGGLLYTNIIPRVQGIWESSSFIQDAKSFCTLSKQIDPAPADLDKKKIFLTKKQNFHRMTRRLSYGFHRSTTNRSQNTQ